MLKINKKIEYALMALKYISLRSSDQFFSTREICDEFHMPFDTMSKVMQILTNAGILKSAKGIKGGHQLNRPLHSVSYYELNVLLEGETFGDYCNGPKEICQQYSQCNIHEPLHVLNDKLREFFKDVGLHELLMTNTNVNQKNQNTREDYDSRSIQGQ